LEQLDGTPYDRDSRPGHVLKEKGNAPTTTAETSKSFLDRLSLSVLVGGLAGAVGIATLGPLAGIAAYFVGGFGTLAVVDRTRNGDSSSGAYANEGSSKKAQVFHPETSTTHLFRERHDVREYRENSSRVAYESDRILAVTNLEIPPGEFTSLPEPNLNEYKLIGVAPLQANDQVPRSTAEHREHTAQAGIRERFAQARQDVAEFGVALFEQSGQKEGSGKIAVYHGTSGPGVNGEMSLDSGSNVLSLHGTVSQLGQFGDVVHQLRKYDSREGADRYFVGDRLFLLKDGVVIEFERPPEPPREVTFYMDGTPIYSKPEPGLSLTGNTTT
jgi:hypothetical protein